MSKTKILFVSLLLVFVAVLLACKKSTQEQQAGNRADQSNLSLTKEPEKPVRLKTFTYIEHQGIGIEAFRVLIPSEWHFEGGIRWVLDNPGMPAVASFRIYNLGGIEELEVFPNRAFFWTDNPTLLQTFPAGTRYFGNEARNKLALAYIQQAKFEQATDALNKILGIAAAFRTSPASGWIREAAYYDQLTRQSQALLRRCP